MKNKGFSLLELLVVVAIMLILSSGVAVSIKKYRKLKIDIFYKRELVKNLRSRELKNDLLRMKYGISIDKVNRKIIYFTRKDSNNEWSTKTGITPKILEEIELPYSDVDIQTKQNDIKDINIKQLYKVEDLTKPYYIAFFYQKELVSCVEVSYNQNLERVDLQVYDSGKNKIKESDFIKKKFDTKLLKKITK